MDHIERLMKLADDRNYGHQAYLQYILLFSSPLFGILVTQTDNFRNDVQKSIYQAVLSLLLVGILFVSGALYSHVYASRKLHLLWKEELEASLHENRSPSAVFVKPLKIFSFFEITGYVSLLIALLLLVINALF